MSVLELFQQSLFVSLEVLVNDDFRLIMALCHLHGSPAEDGYPTNALLGKHVVEHRSADEAGRACEDEMHCCVNVVFDYKVVRSTIDDCLIINCR